jgi:hypothetical protein
MLLISSIVLTLLLSLLVDKLESLEAKQVALELLVLMTMSTDARDNPVVFFRTHSDTMFTSLDKITKVDQELGKLVIALDTFTKNKVDLNPTVKTIFAYQGATNE